MYGIIASQDYADNIKAVLQGEQILFERIGFFNPEEFLKHCTAAAAVALHILIVDMTCCDSDAAIAKGIQKYRISREARIIVLAPGREPGDPVISFLVGTGVYDIVAPVVLESDDDERKVADIGPYLQRQLEMTYHYGNAVRWDVRTLAEPAPIKEKAAKENRQKRFSLKEINFELPQTREKIVYHDRIVGQVVIAVGGIDRRTGSTHTSIQLATFLKRSGYSVLCLEVIDPEFSPSSFGFLPKDESTSKGFRMEGIEYIPKATEETILDALASDVQYLVLDMGRLVSMEGDQMVCHERFIEFVRADVPIMTTTVSLGDYRNLMQWSKQSNGWQKKVKVCVNLSSQDTFRQFSTSVRAQMSDSKLYPNPFQPDPFLMESDQVAFFQNLLEAVLPKKKQKKSWGALFRKTKETTISENP